jgi:hypothetical protein
MKQISSVGSFQLSSVERRVETLTGEDLPPFVGGGDVV